MRIALNLAFISSMILRLADKEYNTVFWIFISLWWMNLFFIQHKNKKLKQNIKDGGFGIQSGGNININ